MYIYIYVHIHTHSLSLYIYIYIYIYIPITHIYIYIYVYVCIYIYIYIYTNYPSDGATPQAFSLLQMSCLVSWSTTRALANTGKSNCTSLSSEVQIRQLNSTMSESMCLRVKAV